MIDELNMSGKSFAIYARTGNDEIHYSLQRQIRNCVTYVKEMGGTLIAVHAERACGCDPAQGPEYKALINLIEEGGIDYLLCESLDRLCSQALHFIALRSILDAKEVEVVTVGGMVGAYGTHRIADIVSTHMRSDMAMRVRRGKALAKALWR